MTTLSEFNEAAANAAAADRAKLSTAEARYMDLWIKACASGNDDDMAAAVDAAREVSRLSGTGGGLSGKLARDCGGKDGAA